MTNRAILKQLLNDIKQYSNSRENRSDFAISFIDAIESLEDIPFSIMNEARDWQYRIETDGYVDKAGYEKLNKQLFAQLSLWVNNLLRSYG
tara:strand:+ start:52277 stop:52549 length:273 start_codon:yes stop_codon:yes gene_type:complete